MSLSLSSCDDRKEEGMGQYATILYFTKAGEVPLTLYKTGEDTNYDVSINKAGSSLGASTQVVVDLMTAGDLEIHNIESGKNYALLPSTCYTLESATNLSFKANELDKQVNVRFITDQIALLDAQKEWVLPMQLIQSKDSINPTLNQIFVKPTVVIPTLYFAKTGYNSTVVTSSSPEVLTLTLPIQLPLKNQWDFTVDVVVEQELLDAYNAANGTKLQLLPASTYELAEQVHFTPNVSEQTVSIRLTRSLLEYGEYVLPLQLANCSKESFQIDPLKSSCLFAISYSPPQLTLLPSMLSSNAEEPYEGSLAELLDNNVNTFFHSNWSNPSGVIGDHNLQINLDQSITTFRFMFTTRSSNGNGNPAAIDVMVSEDGVNFQSLQVLQKEGLPTGAASDYDSPVFKASKPIKHIRLSVPINMTGGKFFVMSEFKLWGI